MTNERRQQKRDQRQADTQQFRVRAAVDPLEYHGSKCPFCGRAVEDGISTKRGFAHAECVWPNPCKKARKTA